MVSRTWMPRAAKILAAAAAAIPVSAAAPVVTAKTVPVSSSVGGYLLPAVLFLGIAGGLISGLSRLALRLRGVR